MVPGRYQTFHRRNWILFTIAGLLCALPAAYLPAQEEKTVRVGVYENPPKIFTDDRGEVSGFLGELVKDMAERHGWTLEFVPGTWTECLDRTEAGDIDLMPDVAFSIDRMKRFLFNEEDVFVNWGVIYTRNGFYPESFSDLDGARVAGLDGGIHTVGPLGIANLARSFGINIDLIPVENYAGTFEMIDQGQADAAVVNRIFGISNAQYYHINRTQLIFDPISIRFAFPKKDGSDRLIAEVDSSLREYKADPDSVYFGLMDDFLTGFVTEQVRIPVWVYITFASAAVIILVLAILGTLLNREVRRRMRSEAELARAKELAEEANQAKSTFLANMTHEIRTPMNAILGYAEILQHDDGIGERQKADLEIIHKSGRHLMLLINDVLDMSRLGAGKLSNDPVTVNLRGFVTEVLSFFGPSAMKKGIDLRSGVSRDLPPFLIIDERKLRQVLINLVGNAVKFTQEGFVELWVGTPGADSGTLEITITDTGPGIDDANPEALFEPFEQGNRPVSGEGGTGLGLAISRGLLRIMGGDLVLARHSREGCVFRCTVPYEPGEKQEAGRRKDRKVIGLRNPEQSLKILVADDNKTNRDIVRAILMPLGINSKFARDGSECVEVCRDWLPDLIVMDVKMPVMDGIQATETIRKSPWGLNTKILAVSASTLASDRGKVLASGADEFLYKPFWVREFLDAISRLLGVEYRYADEEPIGSDTEATPAQFDPKLVGEEIRTEILRGCRLGSRKAVIDILAKYDELPRDFVDYIRETAEVYDFSAIETWLDMGDEDV